jgi:hypothetical protein
MRPGTVTVFALLLLGCLAFGVYLLAVDPYIRLIP